MLLRFLKDYTYIKSIIFFAKLNYMNLKRNYIFLILFILNFSQTRAFWGWFSRSENVSNSIALTAPSQNAQISRDELERIARTAGSNVLLNNPVTVVNCSLQQPAPTTESNHERQALLSDYYNRFASKAAEQTQAVGNWIANNKIKSFFIGITVGTLSIQAYLLYLENKLKDPNCWSLWDRSKSLAELYSLSQADMSEKILKDIQRTYTTIKNPTDFVTPLIIFLEDTQFEERYLRHYKLIIEKSRKIYLNKILMYDDALLRSVDERLERLKFIKITFLTWLATYKINFTAKDIPLNITSTLRRYRSISD